MSHQKKTKKRSIKRNMLVSILTSTSIILLIIFFSYYLFYHYQFKTKIRNELTGLAQTAAFLIDSDKHDLLKTRNDEKTQKYLEIKKILQSFKVGNPNIRFIYTMRKTDKKDIWEFVVDAEDENSKDISHIGDLYDVLTYPEMKKAYELPSADKSFEKDQWGVFLSGYAPIKDKSGKTVGIVGIDIEADTLRIQESHMLLGALIIFLIAIGLITLIIIKKVNYFVSPINRIMEGIRQIGKGNLKYRVEIKTNDEFEDIGELIKNTASIMANYQILKEKELINTKELMEKDLKIEREQREKLFNVYKDVIYSITQGKFNLVKSRELLQIVDEGILYDKIILSTPNEVDVARKMIAQFLESKGSSQQNIMHTMLCVSEATTNVIKHAKEGDAQIRKLNDKLRVIVQDHGPGMDFNKLPNMIFLKGYSTKDSLGFGFSLIYRFADKIYLATSEAGTLLAMDFLIR